MTRLHSECLGNRVGTLLLKKISDTTDEKTNAIGFPDLTFAELRDHEQHGADDGSGKVHVAHQRHRKVVMKARPV